jgi:hypothetical protein
MLCNIGYQSEVFLMKTVLMCIASAAAVAVVASAAQVRADESYCREYTQAVRVGGKMQEGYGTACMQPDGSWQIIKPAEGDTIAANSVVEEEYFTLPQPALAPVYMAQPQSSFNIFYSNYDRGYRRGWRGHGYGHGHHHHYHGHGGRHWR